MYGMIYIYILYMFDEFHWLIACCFFCILEYTIYKCLPLLKFKASIINAWKVSKIVALAPMLLFLINFIIFDDESEITQFFFTIQLEYTEGFIIVNTMNIIFNAIMYSCYSLNELLTTVFSMAVLFLPIESIATFHIVTLVLFQYIPDIVFSIIELCINKINDNSFSALPVYNNFNPNQNEINTISKMNYTGLVIWILFKHVLIGFLLMYHLISNLATFWDISFDYSTIIYCGYLLGGLFKYFADIYKTTELYKEFKITEQKMF